VRQHRELPTLFLLFVLWGALVAMPCHAADSADPGEQKASQEVSTSPVGWAWKTLMYVPNRVFDLVDIVRLRARIGPGLAVGAQATQLARVYLGSYTSVWAGLPGPRLLPVPPIPAGVETLNGAQLSFLGVSNDGLLGPSYSSTEVGLNLHLLLIGVGVGIDPMEIADFLGGIIGFDPREDDL
jgi:hypothetical protein